jgi:hypothetical protein
MNFLRKPLRKHDQQQREEECPKYRSLRSCKPMIMAKEAKGKKNGARDKENRARISTPDEPRWGAWFKQKVSFRN